MSMYKIFWTNKNKDDNNQQFKQWTQILYTCIYYNFHKCNSPLRPIVNFAESLTKIKTVFCLQRQNKASNPDRPQIILKNEIVSFNLI